MEAHFLLLPDTIDADMEALPPCRQIVGLQLLLAQKEVIDSLLSAMDANVLHFQRPFNVIAVCPLNVGLTVQLLALRDDLSDGMVIVEDQIAAQIPEVY